MTEIQPNSGQRLYRKARGLIPGGTQLLSKRPEMFLPDHWPSYYAKAEGAYIWDLDGNRYADFSHFNVGACTLGYADPDVTAAVIAAEQAGSATTLNCPEEVELAELMLDLHPWAEMVRFGRGGGEIMAVAIRIARAATGRDLIAFSGYHGWHDWYIAANLGNDDTLNDHLLPGLASTGVARGLRGTVLPFGYNRPEELEAMVQAHGKNIACIVMEPVRSEGPEPAPGFLEAIRAIADRIGAVLIFDEVTSGWRMTDGGIHKIYGVNPDMAAFSKAMGNGHAVAAVIGKAGVMDAAQKTFISSTSWTERLGPAAALATIRKYRREEVWRRQIAAGREAQDGWSAAAAAAGLPIRVSGIPPLSHIDFIYKSPRAAMTLFTQLLLERGFLAGNRFYPALCHTPELVHSYLTAVSEAFAIMAPAVAAGRVEELLRGPVKHGTFERLR